MAENTKHLWADQKVYYWNARLNGQTALLAGPFLTAQEAEACADIVSPLFIAEHPKAAYASFGVMRCNSPGVPSEKVLYNKHLPDKLYGKLAIGIRLQ